MLLNDLKNRGWTAMHEEILDPETDNVGSIQKTDIQCVEAAANIRTARRSERVRHFTPLSISLILFRAFNFGDFANGRAQQPLPLSLQKYEAELSRFSELCRELAMKLLELFAIGLEVYCSRNMKLALQSPFAC